MLAFVRSHESQCILVVANLSRFADYVELDLADYEGLTPVELFGGRPFPPVRRQPYLLSLAPHSFYWFSLELPPVAQDVRVEAAGDELSVLQMSGSWENGLRDEGRQALEQALPAVLQSRRWFGGKAQSVRSASIFETIRLPKNNGLPG